MSFIEQKRQLRRMLKAQAAQLDLSYCREADRAIFKSITDLPEYQRAERIFCFVLPTIPRRGKVRLLLAQALFRRYR